MRPIEMANSIALKNYHKVLKRYTTLAIKHRNPTIVIPDCLVYRFKQNGTWKQLALICLRREDLLNVFMEWAYDLAERNLKQKYLAYGFRWQKHTTYVNLFMYWARYLIAYDPTNYIPFGYVMFRFDFVLGHTIVNIYDLHVEEQYQRKGIGTHLMITLEVLARRFGMQLLMVAVAKKDVDLKRFLLRLGYRADSKESAKYPECEVLIAPTKCYKIINQGS
uniref:N-alpha-acetyltransferase 40 n=2 Tax=Anopheles coluzzii TaxID=1518534 RepID=A0A6E8VYK8_ANOCL